MDIIIIDDELPALRQFKHLLKPYEDVAVRGTFLNPVKALDYVRRHNVDIAFLDIHMPRVGGIDLAEKIHEAAPNVSIVFVTAYDSHALEAFEVEAHDYLLKPVSPKRLERTMERMRERVQASSPAERQLHIDMLGAFEMHWEDGPPFKWRTKKTKELMACLIHFRNQTVSKDKILDALWPDMDYDKAMKQLYNGIYHIRRTLKTYEVDKSILLIDSEYNVSLDERAVTVDTDVFYRIKNSAECDIETLESVVASYEGDYLQSEFFSWAEPEAYTLRSIYLDGLYALSRKHLELQQWEQAERHLKAMLRKDPYNERAVMEIMKLFEKTGRKSEAITYYNDYRNKMEKDMKVAPSKKVEMLMSRLFQ